MTYDDHDLAALIRRRDLVPAAALDAAVRAAAATGSRRDGALGRMLVRLRALDPPTVERLAAELARAGPGQTRVDGPARPPVEDVHATRQLPPSDAGALGATRHLPPEPAAGPEWTGDGSTGKALTSTAARRAKAVGTHQELGPGSRVATYVVESEISRGAMGVVLRARHQDVQDRVVAIKVMAGDLHGDPDSQRRFQREGEALARLDHPDVVRVYEAGVLEDGRPYLAMDFVRGRTLEAMAKAEGPLALERAASMLARVARAVAFMNRRGVVHRDLKLGNVLLDEQDAPKIADFGLAFVADGKTRLTREGDLLGTPLYMPPEVVEGSLEVDARVDVYALGVMLYRLVVGSYPFYADTSAELFEKVLTGAPAWPADLTPDCRAVLETALARDRTRRYRDADALAHDLDALASGAPVVARARTRGERLVDALGGSPARLLGLGAVALVGLLLAAGLIAAGRWRARQRAQDVASRADELGQVQASLEAEADGVGLSRARAAVAVADEALEAARKDAVDPALVERLADARTALAAAISRAGVVAVLTEARADGVVDLTEREAVAQAFSLAPAGDAAFERVRGEVLLGAGRLEAAGRALETAVSGLAGEAQVAARCARAWCRLRTGSSGPEPASDLPPQEQALVALARAGLATHADARAAALAEARARAAAAPPAARGALEGLLLAEEVAGERADPPRLRAALEGLRRTSDPARPPAVPPAADEPGPVLRGLCAIAEGDVALRLGWPEAAVEAYARALPLVGDAAWPAALARLGDDPTSARALLAPDGAARLGEARARARLQDGPAALAAAEAAATRLRHDVALPALAAALLLRAEARQLEAPEAPGRAALDEVAAIVDREPGAAPLAPWLFRAQDRGPVLTGERPAPAGDAELAGWYLAQGEADLVAASVSASDPAPRLARLRRAERALRLALVTDRGAAASGWAALARAALLRRGLQAGGTPGGEAAALGAARAAVAEAEEAAGAGDVPWRVRLARGLVAAASGESATAREALLAAFAGASAEPGRRLLERMEEALPVADEGVRALDKLDPEGALLLRDRAAAFAVEGRLPGPVREGQLADLVRRAEQTGSAAQRKDARERYQALQTQGAELKKLYDVARRYLTRSTLAEGGEVGAAARELLQRSPAECDFLDANHFANYELRQTVFHGLTLGFELRPSMLLTKANAGRFFNRNDPNALGVAQGSVPALAFADLLDPTVPLPPDPDLRVAAAPIFFLECGLRLPLDPAKLDAGLAGATRAVVRRPRCHAAWFALARLRMVAGDAAGALAALERLDLLPTIEKKKTDERWLHLFRALCHGGLRRWESCMESIRAACAAGFDDPPRLRDEEPWLRVDRGSAATLYSELGPIVAKLQKELEEREKQGRPR